MFIIPTQAIQQPYPPRGTYAGMQLVDLVVEHYVANTLIFPERYIGGEYAHTISESQNKSLIRLL